MRFLQRLFACLTRDSSNWRFTEPPTGVAIVISCGTAGAIHLARYDGERFVSLASAQSQLSECRLIIKSIMFELQQEDAFDPGLAVPDLLMRLAEMDLG